MLKLYNTLTRKKENFKPIKKTVGMYTCGPTVYWYQHIGNLRSYIFADLLKRVLLYNKYKVKQIINVTDVGHLTSDRDTGEDKMEKAAKKENKKAKDIANFYLKLFKEDFKKLNILPPDKWTKATQHIKDQIQLIKTLEKKGFTYQTSDGVYFNTSKVKDYGKLARLKKQDLKAGKRVSLKEKKNKTDFALWKFSKKKGLRQQEWKSPWGLGFPGWHIECSAMSTKYLGKQFDIHTGGKEHIPVHHTNEIAQSESAFNKKPWVKYWLHGEWLMFKDGKMSKSKGKIYTLEALERKGFQPLEYRYFVLNAHYKKPLKFDWKALENSRNAYSRLKNIISETKNDKKLNKKYLKQFEKAINNNLDMPNAIAVMWNLLRDKKETGKINTIKEMDKVLGLDLLKKDLIPKEIKDLVKKREQARKNKDWKKSDKLRDKIKSKGYEIKDKEKKTIIMKLA